MAAPPMTRPGDGGMLPLYDMANGFVNAVIPTLLLDALEEYGVGGLADNWQSLVLGLLGLVSCIVIGVLYCLLMPCAGCCVCCCRTCCSKCRCCPCCCKPKSGPPSRCKKVTCMTVVFVCTAFMFSAVVCSYVALQQLRYEVSPSGFLNDVTSGLGDAETYVQDTGNQLNDIAVTGLEDTADQISRSLDSLATDSVGQLANATGMEPALTELLDYVNSLPDFADDLGQMTNSTAELDGLVVTLDGELAARRDSIGTLLANCTASVGLPDCASATAQLPLVRPEANFTQCQDVSGQQATIEAIVASGLVQQVNAEAETFTNLTQTLDDTIGGEVSDIEATLDSQVTTVTDTVLGLTEPMVNFSLAGIQNTVSELKNPTHLYGNYAVTGLEVLAAVSLAVCGVYFTALALGLVGSPAGYKHGANLLLAGAGLTFLLGWLAMLVTTLTFVAGGATESALCRHLVANDDSLDRIQALVAEQVVLPSALQNLSVRGLMDGCQQDETLYQLLDPEERYGINISQIISLESYNVSDTVEEIKATPITLPPVEVMSNSTASALLYVYNVTQSVDLASYDGPLAQPVTATSLPDYADQLVLIADQLVTSNPSVANGLYYEAGLLRDVEAGTVAEIEAEMAVLQTAVDGARVVIDTPVPAIVDQLTAAQDMVNAHGEEMIGAAINDTLDQIVADLDDYLAYVEYSVVNELGACRGLYDAITSLIYGPCVYLLNPTQALWFTFGWYLAFGVICLGVAVKMADVYRELGEAAKVNPLSELGEEPEQFTYGYGKLTPPVPMEPLPPAPPPTTKPPAYNATAPTSEALYGTDVSKKGPETLHEHYLSPENPF